MTKRERIKEIFQTLKSGVRMCELLETKNLLGEVVGFHQGKSISCPWPYVYIYVRHYGQWAHKATLENLTSELGDCNLDNFVTESEFEKKSGESFFGWGI